QYEVGTIHVIHRDHLMVGAREERFLDYTALRGQPDRRGDGVGRLTVLADPHPIAGQALEPLEPFGVCRSGLVVSFCNRREGQQRKPEDAGSQSERHRLSPGQKHHGSVRITSSASEDERQTRKSTASFRRAPRLTDRISLVGGCLTLGG